jgi:hypothetical protein
MTILGGFAGSLLYVFLLTAVGNLGKKQIAFCLPFSILIDAFHIPEKFLLGPSSQSGLTEVAFCIFLAVSAAGSIHRVSATTCFLFSLGKILTILLVLIVTFAF